MEQLTNHAIMHDEIPVTRVLKPKQVSEVGVQPIFQFKEVVYSTFLTTWVGG
jgi:hypothetical protein